MRALTTLSPAAARCRISAAGTAPSQPALGVRDIRGCRPCCPGSATALSTSRLPLVAISSDNALLIAAVTAAVNCRGCSSLARRHLARTAEPNDRSCGSSSSSRMATLWALALMIAADRNSIGLLLVVVLVLGRSLQTAYSAGAHAVLPQIVPRSSWCGPTATSRRVRQRPGLHGRTSARRRALCRRCIAAARRRRQLRHLAVLLTVALPLVARAPGARRSFRQDLGEGITYFRGNQVLRTLAVATAVLAFAQAMVMATLVPLRAAQRRPVDRLRIRAGSRCGGQHPRRHHRCSHRPSFRHGDRAHRGRVHRGGGYVIGGGQQLPRGRDRDCARRFPLSRSARSRSVSRCQRLVPPSFLGVGNIFRLVDRRPATDRCTDRRHIGCRASRQSVTDVFVAGIAQAAAMVVLGPLRRVMRRNPVAG